MRYSGIGGQAVMEGVMMKNQDKYAVAVRKPNKEIEIMISEYTGIMKNKKIKMIHKIDPCPPNIPSSPSTTAFKSANE